MVKRELFAKATNGQEVYKYTIESEDIKVSIIEYGAIIQSFINKKTNEDIVLGYDSIQEYEDNPSYFCVTVGRNANRIKGSSFIVNSKKYNIEKNEGENHLHGGKNGLHKKVWSLEKLGTDIVVLKCVQHEFEDGYPGTLTVYATIMVDKDTLKISYDYICDEDSVVNLTNHAYFNLNEKGDILNHKVKLNSKFMTPFDEENIPTGEIVKVESTAFDFRQYKNIGEMIEKNQKILQGPRGYDHNFIVDKMDDEIHLNASILNDTEKTKLEVYSNAPCFQFYTGNFIADCIGKNNQKYSKRSGFCIEPQFVPNSVNMPQFSSPRIKKDTFYNRTIKYKLISL